MGNRQSIDNVSSSSPSPRNDGVGIRSVPKVLLHGCHTTEEHEEHIRRAVDIIKGTGGVSLKGEEGLKAIGFEFLFVPCVQHAVKENATARVSSPQDSAPSAAVRPTPTAAPKEKYKTTLSSLSEFSSGDGHDIITRNGWHSCNECVTRLYHIGFPTKSSSTSTNETTVTCQTCLDEAPSTNCTNKAKSNDVDEETAAMLHTFLNDDTTKVKKFSPSDVQPELVQSTTTAPSHFHPPTPTMITTGNRQQFIADGLHYELVSTLAQETAQEMMRRTFHLEWITICDDDAFGEHVRALVDHDHRLILEDSENRLAVEELLGVHFQQHTPTTSREDEKKEDSPLKLNQQPVTKSNKSTLLIATGRGKVRAGIFSRQHLLTSGVEVGTAWHNVREARERGMGLAIIDPNARGEGEGLETFKKSMNRLFSVVGSDATTTTTTIPSEAVKDVTRRSSSSSSTSNQTPAIYILAHSASGGQLVRHLREDPTLLPSIRAIAFTDSTHNVQWCKQDPTIMKFLETNNCLYLRSNDVRSSQSCIHVSSRGKDIACKCVACVDTSKSAGVKADTDTFWEHRFGKIKTLWAGTADHALSNWAAHEPIWRHFGQHLSVDDGNDDINEKCLD